MGSTHKMAMETTEKIPAFRRSEFETYLQTLRSACTHDSGSIALTARYDPITSHINDPFVLAKINGFSSTEQLPLKMALNKGWTSKFNGCNSTEQGQYVFNIDFPS